MANIVSAKTYLNDLEISADAPITTQLNTRIGGAINYLNDKTDSLQTSLDSVPPVADILNRQLVSVSFNNASPTANISTAGSIRGVALFLTYPSVPSYMHSPYFGDAVLAVRGTNPWETKIWTNNELSTIYTNGLGPIGGFWANGLKYFYSTGGTEVWAYLTLTSATNINLQFGGILGGTANLAGFIIHDS